MWTIYLMNNQYIEITNKGALCAFQSELAMRRIALFWIRNSFSRTTDEEIVQIILQYSKFGLTSVKYKLLNKLTGNLFFIRLRIPICLLTLLHTSDIWSSQVSFSLIITTTNLVCLTLSNWVLSLHILISTFSRLVANNIKLHFCVLTDNLFNLNHILISNNALFARTGKLLASLSCRNTYHLQTVAVQRQS